MAKKKTVALLVDQSMDGVTYPVGKLLVIEDKQAKSLKAMGIVDDAEAAVAYRESQGEVPIEVDSPEADEALAA